MALRLTDAEASALRRRAELENRSMQDERLALAGAIAVLGVNGRRLTLANDEAYDLVIAVATGKLAEIAEALGRGSSER
jgi:death-on-curing protein